MRCVRTAPPECSRAGCQTQPIGLRGGAVAPAGMTAYGAGGTAHAGAHPAAYIGDSAVHCSAMEAAEMVEVGSAHYRAMTPPELISHYQR